MLQSVAHTKLVVRCVCLVGIYAYRRNFYAKLKSDLQDELSQLIRNRRKFDLERDSSSSRDYEDKKMQVNLVWHVTATMCSMASMPSLPACTIDFVRESLCPHQASLESMPHWPSLHAPVAFVG